MWFLIQFCKNSGQQSIKRFVLHIGVLNYSQLSNVDQYWMTSNVFGGTFYYVSTIFAKSHEKSHRLWTKNLSLARGLLALQIKIPLGIHFLGPWKGGKWFDFCWITLTSPPGHPIEHALFQLVLCFDPRVDFEAEFHTRSSLRSHQEYFQASANIVDIKLDAWYLWKNHV